MKKSTQTEETPASNGHAPTDTVTSTSSTDIIDAEFADVEDTIPFDQGEVKSNLDRAWEKIQNGLQQEAQGSDRWIEGTLELINILHDARERLASDQAFGSWLTKNGYGEDRLKRNDRQALQNMAQHPDLTREVLEQTHRRSWRLIWEEEIQPRLHNAVQPAGDESAEAIPTNNAEEADTRKKPTRRPRKGNGTRNTPPKDEWGKDLKNFLSDGLLIANALIRIKKGICGSKPEKKAELRKKVTTAWLEPMEQGSKAYAWICDWANGMLDEEADKLIQEGRVVETPTHASKQVQPEA
jgi:hypothetical protein